MADTTKIEWTDATWNPITGCTVHSAGCTNCYAMQLAGTRLRDHPSRKGLTRKVNGNHVWTGEVKFNEQWLLQPLKWKRPRDIFVCAHADLFHEKVPDEWIDKIFAVMALAPQHRFQVLTKRSARMRAYITSLLKGNRRVLSEMSDLGARKATANCKALWGNPFERKPLPHVWLGVSVEDQKAADERIPDLLATPAAIRWLSCEPLLGPVDLRKIVLRRDGAMPDELSRRLGDYIQPLTGNFTDSPRINWIVCGGESGRKARPMHPDWARSLRDQCAAAGIPFHFKQWGEWAPGAANTGAGDGLMARVGKKAAGRLLDGVHHDGRPI